MAESDAIREDSSLAFTMVAGAVTLVGIAAVAYLNTTVLKDVHETWATVVGLGALLAVPVIASICGAVVACNVDAGNDRRERDHLFNLGKNVRSTFGLKMLNRDFVILDTNIWLNEEAENGICWLAELCRLTESKLTLFGAEFEEVIRLKNSAGGARAARARAALRLIEQLQADGILKSFRMNVDHVPKAYFDRAVQRFIETRPPDENKVLLITDDVELRARVRGRLQDEMQLPVTVAGTEELGFKGLPDVDKSSGFYEGFTNL